MTPGDGAVPRLHDHDQQAFDALVDSGWQLEGVPEEHRRAAERLLELLAVSCQSTADSGDFEASPEIVRTTLDKIPVEASLAPDSADALDLWNQSAYQADAVPRALREQASRHAMLADLVTLAVHGSDVEASDHLVDGAISRVMAAEDAGPAPDFSFRLRTRLVDIASVAALLLVCVSVVMPVTATMRQASIRYQNQGNFAMSSIGFGCYGNDHDGALPVYTPTEAFAVASDKQRFRHWWLVGSDPTQSNSANLYTLTRLGYATIDVLTSPGNPDAIAKAPVPGAVDWDSFEQVSYSYRVDRGQDDPTRWSTRGNVILTDRSPVTLKAYHRLPIDPFENSPNHAGRGQHVLHGDGSVDWLTTPGLPGTTTSICPSSWSGSSIPASGDPG